MEIEINNVIIKVSWKHEHLERDTTTKRILYHQVTNGNNKLVKMPSISKEPRTCCTIELSNKMNPEEKHSFIACSSIKNLTPGKVQPYNKNFGRKLTLQRAINTIEINNQQILTYEEKKAIWDTYRSMHGKW